MDSDAIQPIRAITPILPVLHLGPTGESYERNGPEETWGEGQEAAAAYDAQARAGEAVQLTGVVRAPTPFVPTHHERWGDYFWLTTGSEVLRILLGPMSPFARPALRVAPGESVTVAGYRIYLHGEHAIVAATVRRGRTRAVLLDAQGQRVAGR